MMKNEIWNDRIFYHIYPLGMAGCPKHNDFSCPAGSVFEKLEGQLDGISALGVNALYIGPVFESSSHGYDTVDYFWIDRRLGNNEKFRRFVQVCHEKGIKVVVDTVFNHTGRDFFAFKDIIANAQSSRYRDWYLNLRFDRRSSYNDPFDYDGWAGCKDLVKLNVDNMEVREHLKSAVAFWVKEFDIDGLRLDAADVLSKDFLTDLSHFAHGLKKDFWLMGEVVHGDYNDWVNPDRIDSVTNYQIYKALWSSLNEKNMWELSYNLNREFGPKGIYNYSALYNFIDNHDVNRIASTLNNIEELHLLYGMLFMIPGIPSIYYYSENAIRGKRGERDDYQLRPCVPPFADGYDFWAKPETDSEALKKSIARFASIRSSHKAICRGSFENLAVTNNSLVFKRQCEDETIIVAINAEGNQREIALNNEAGNYEDLLTGKSLGLDQNAAISIPRYWLRILIRK